MVGRCLYDHNPSPQRCARMGGVWDDSGSALAHGGGKCITEAQAQQRYDAAAGGIEMETVQLSHDGGLAGFGELGAYSTIRQRRPSHLLQECLSMGSPQQCSGSRRGGSSALRGHALLTSMHDSSC